MSTDIYRRPPLTNRPWIQGKLYDDLARKSILHVDAWVMATGALKYLVIDYREGGRARIALDAYLISADGLTPVWDALGAVDRAASVTDPSAALHARVTMAAREAQASGRWARVSLLAHYVACGEIDVEAGLTKYVRKLPNIL